MYSNLYFAMDLLRSEMFGLLLNRSALGIRIS
jgi:hypothetical protein